MKSDLLKIFFSIFVSITLCVAHADTDSENVFVQALIQGKATAPIPAQDEFQKIIMHLQEQTQNQGMLIIQAWLIKRFQQQPQCGRVAFLIAQPDSNTVWANIGGQLNICEAGTPPLKICPNQPNVLVTPDHKCQDNKNPQDTQEIIEAIRAALNEGGVSQEKVKNQWRYRDSQP